jgi:hypothetical protein
MVLCRIIKFRSHKGGRDFQLKNLNLLSEKIGAI